MERKYKGCSISFDESKDCFLAYRTGEEFSRNISLAQLKKQIDMLLKKKFERLSIYYLKYEDTIEKGEITSFNSIQKEVWVSFGRNKTREKVNMRWANEMLLKPTKENIEKANRIKEMKKEIDCLQKETEKIVETLEKYTYSELCKISGQTEID